MLVEEVLSRSRRGMSAYRNSRLLPDPGRSVSFTRPRCCVRAVGATVAGPALPTSCRTSMHLDGYSQPLQLIHATAEVPVTIHDLRGLSREGEIDAQALAYVEHEQSTGFDLAAAPLLRIAAHLESDPVLADERSVPSARGSGEPDGPSISLLMELLGAYQALRDGREPAGYEVPSVPLRRLPSPPSRVALSVIREDPGLLAAFWSTPISPLSPACQLGW